MTRLRVTMPHNIEATGDKATRLLRRQRDYSDDSAITQEATRLLRMLCDYSGDESCGNTMSKEVDC